MNIATLKRTKFVQSTIDYIEKYLRAMGTRPQSLVVGRDTLAKLRTAAGESDLDYNGIQLTDRRA